ncbi:imelysin family protein [Draconibacterium sp. IB214405]|uniref:imelysin family protein n=1 Tax=Draconibacterium sp. IB214405 TaxID=3097352 RepID=UPI002A10D4AE|nr:imelysin family protein [Draconibacterium sp. IB214405]MDX8341367.1 imelysin family protein [Draconibacterium sp. IB214405]
MKKFNPFLFLTGGLALFTVACSENDDATDTDLQDAKVTEVITDYTNLTVIKTYENMASNAISLVDVIQNFSAELSDAEVEAAAEAWKDTREYWEKSEAFLFGPAAFNNLDPLLDSWPLDKDQLDQVLADVEAEKIAMSSDYVRNSLGASLRGFHAVEYLLFRDGAARTASSFSVAELTYLEAVAQVLAEDCTTLEAWWSGTEYLTTEKQALLEAAELEVGDAFGNELINAGLSGSRYVSQYAALEEIIQGAMDIADEVGNAKIADPVESGNVLDVESWYSWNSLTDFVNNINSIENAYLGGLSENERGASLSDLVKAESAELDEEIKASITKAKDEISNIGMPFRNNLSNTTATDAATEACNELFTSLKKVKDIL